MPTSESHDVSILMPVFNDWPSAIELVRRIETKLGNANGPLHFLLVDDGSSEEAPQSVAAEASTQVDVLHLRRNMGHQRAIAIGLSFLREKMPGRGAVVMDADGEDTPDGVAELLEEFRSLGGKKTVFAARARRTESLVFRSFYKIFRALHLILTGQGVRFGNFSVIPSSQIERLVAVSELWNHYSAAVVKARLPYVAIPIDRGTRIFGESRMSFVSLMAHGLSAIAVFADVVGLRLLVVTTLLGAVTAVGILAIVAVRFMTDLAIPGWATTAAGFLALVLLQAFLLALVFVFIVLQARNTGGFLPIRDFEFFALSIRRLQNKVIDDDARLV